MTAHNLTFKERFDLKYTKNPGCWEWNAFVSPFGYGFIRQNGGNTLAHRASWELFVGTIPKGMLVLHKCDNPPCVNPEHLFLGTHQDNSDDKCAKNRQFRSRGELSASAKLTWPKVAEIRSLKGTAPDRVIAKQFGVARATVNAIQRGQSWISP
jgi:hypothetical protein